MDRSLRRSLVVSFLLFAPAMLAQATPRRPRGVYTKVDISNYIAQQQQANPSITAAELEEALDALYEGLLADPAISGLELGVHWDLVNPNPPAGTNAYAWNYVDDAFAQAAGANKTIQRLMDPGF
jgi:hypothetical protein